MTFIHIKHLSIPLINLYGKLMAKITLTNIGSRYGSIDAINANFDAIESAIQNTFSRDGEGPNTLEATVDANNQRIINLPTPVNSSEPATKGWVEAQPNQAASSATAAAASAAAAAVSEANAEVAAEQVVDWEWKNGWTTGVAYKVNNIVSVPSGTYEGWSFICIVNHTAGSTFATDYSAGKWYILAKRGSTGVGTGDMLAANNLSDLANYGTARTNLSVPSTNGTGATGTWAINVTGNAATATTVATNAITESKIADEAIVGNKIKRFIYMAVRTVAAADTYSAEIGSGYQPLNTSTTSLTNVVGVRYTIDKYNGSLRFKATQAGGYYYYTGYDGTQEIAYTTSTLQLYKNGTLIQTYTKGDGGSVVRTNDLSIVPGDVIEWRHRTDNSAGNASIVSTSVLGSNGYTTRPAYITYTEGV